MVLTAPGAPAPHVAQDLRVPFAETQHVHAGMQLCLVEMSRLRGGPAPVSVSRFELSPGAQSPLDTHEDREIWMVAQGSGMLSYRGQAGVPVHTGDVVELESESSHTLTNTGREQLVVFSIWWIDLP